MHPPLTVSHDSKVHGLLSSHWTGSPEQDPKPHMSPWVQGSPSSQFNWLGEKVHPVFGEQKSSVQGLLSAHSSAPPATQTPEEQESPSVQRSPSSHGLMFALSEYRQLPSSGLQPVSTWQLESSSSQITGAPKHSLPSHASGKVHGLPSLQGEPAAAIWNRQPVSESHSLMVHGRPSSQTVFSPPAQLPSVWHDVFSVQTFESSQGSPMRYSVKHAPSRQPFRVQGFPSSHSVGSQGGVVSVSEIAVSGTEIAESSGMASPCGVDSPQPREMRPKTKTMVKIGFNRTALPFFQVP